MIILGLGGILKDPACAVLKDGELVAAVEEEKVARQSRVGALPEEAIASLICASRRFPRPRSTASRWLDPSRRTFT